MFTAASFCCLLLLLAVKSLKDDVGILWPYTGGFEALVDEFYGDGRPPGFLEQWEKVAFLESYEALGAVDVTRKRVGIRSRERFEADDVKWLQSMS